MKNKKLLASALLMLITSNVALAERNGKELFEQLCSSCHVTSGKPTLAPPIFGVVNHVRNVYPQKNEFIEKIVEWVANPQKEKTVMPGAVNRFGLMPKLPYNTVEVRLIAEYLFDGKVELPTWYIEHYKAEHGHEPAQ